MSRSDLFRQRAAAVLRLRAYVARLETTPLPEGRWGYWLPTRGGAQ